MNSLARGTNGAARAAIIADVVIAVWVIVSPFVLSVPSNNPVVWSNVAMGVIAVIVSLIALVNEAVLPILIALGVWIFASGAVFNADLRFVMNNILTTFGLMAAAAISDGLRY